MSYNNPNVPVSLPFAFDPNQFDIMGGGGAFIKESGKFPVIIVGAEMVAVKGNAAVHFLAFTFQITDGPLKGQEFVDRLHINGSQEARDFSYKKLSAIAHATGVAGAQTDARVYCNKPLQAFVEAKQVANTTDPNKTSWNNDVKEYFYADGEQLVKGRYGNSQGTGAAAQQGFAAPNAPAAPAPQGYAPTAPAAAPAPQPQPAAAPAPQQQQQQYAPQQTQPAIDTNVQPQFATAPQQQQQPVQQQQQPVQQQQPPVQQQYAPQQQQQAPAGATGGFTPPPAPQFAPTAQ